MKGRKPRPTHLKLIEGNPGRRPLKKREPKPKPVASVAKPPAHLSSRGKTVWSHVAAMLARNGILTEADALGLDQLCEAVADYRQARAELKSFGSHYYETENQAGSTMHRAHPALAVMRDADRRIKGWLAEFGMTPSARTRVEGAGEEEKNDPAAKYFGGG